MIEPNRKLSPEEIKELERKLIETRDKWKPQVEVILKEAYKQGLEYKCIWCGHIIKPQDFPSAKEFGEECQNHSDVHAEQLTGIKPER